MVLLLPLKSASTTVVSNGLDPVRRDLYVVRGPSSRTFEAGFLVNENRAPLPFSCFLSMAVKGPQTVLLPCHMVEVLTASYCC